MGDKEREILDRLAKRIKDEHERWGMRSEKNTIDKNRREVAKIIEEHTKKKERG